MKPVNLAYIIDDDEVIIYLTNRLFSKEAFSNKVKTFTCAEAALFELQKAIQNNEEIPDVILFDINMPKMDGWMFIQEFEKLGCKIPTFVFTSSIDQNDKTKSYQYRAIKGFITKPLTKLSIEKIKRIIA
ncbi:MAG: response regulator [Bacteroidota bacterium]